MIITAAQYIAKQKSQAAQAKSVQNFESGVKQLDAQTLSEGHKALKKKITFGKYKNNTIETVLTQDRGYVEWLADNCKNSVGIAAFSALTVIKTNEWREQQNRFHPQAGLIAQNNRFKRTG